MTDRFRSLHRLAISASFASLLGCLPAQAQGFCDIEGPDLLKMLDGAWQVNQGPGGASGGGMAIPLPAQPPITMTFTYSETEGFSLISGPEIPPDTIMTQASIGEEGYALDMVEASSVEIGKSTCRSGKAPVFIASNTGVNALPQREHSELTTRTCLAIGGFLGSAFMALPGQGAYGLHQSWTYPNMDDMSGGEACREVEAVSGAVTTTLIMRFSSSDVGSGIVVFEGAAQGGGRTVSFVGTAPITLTRN